METGRASFDRLQEKPYNRAICRFLLEVSPSAHSDLTEELESISALLPAHHIYCPNPARYAYLIRFTNSGNIFAAAFNMGDLLFNLPAEEFDRALADGGKRYQGLPEDWFAFQAFGTAHSLRAKRQRLRHWCEIAFAKACAVVDDRKG